jgi:small subunit ribosomal protein S17
MTVKTRLGRVLSNKMDKTVVVVVENRKHHPLYHKSIKTSVKYKVHDEKNECGEGDLVRIIETRPLSKEKRWRIAEVVARNEVVDVKPEEVGQSQAAG